MFTFNISAFTHIGSYREVNQDRILVNKHILNEGFIHLNGQTHCCCFVADGVGGNNAGEYAAQYLLEAINTLNYTNSDDLKEQLKKINNNFISNTSNDKNLRGSATTLSGLIINDKEISIVHAGDSEIWWLRNDLLLQISNNMVVNPYEFNSPITSYFGGHLPHLDFDKKSKIDDIDKEDIFLICSDGLFKSIGVKTVKSILKADLSLDIKSERILESCLLLGAGDNVSAIIVEIPQ